jgi:hypothetical protein
MEEGLSRRGQLAEDAGQVGRGNRLGEPARRRTTSGPATSACYPPVGGRSPRPARTVVTGWVTAAIALGTVLVANGLAIGPSLAAVRSRPASLLRNAE